MIDEPPDNLLNLPYVIDSCNQFVHELERHVYDLRRLGRISSARRLGARYLGWGPESEGARVLARLRELLDEVERGGYEARSNRDRRLRQTSRFLADVAAQAFGLSTEPLRRLATEDRFKLDVRLERGVSRGYKMPALYEAAIGTAREIALQATVMWDRARAEWIHRRTGYSPDGAEPSRGAAGGPDHAADEGTRRPRTICYGGRAMPSRGRYAWRILDLMWGKTAAVEIEDVVAAVWGGDDDVSDNRLNKQVRAANDDLRALGAPYEVRKLDGCLLWSVRAQAGDERQLRRVAAG
jgi:hypothetical protein